MRWRLDLYDITNATREAVLPYLSGSFRQGLPNDDTLEFTLPMYDDRGERLFDTNDDASGTNQRYTLTPQKWVRRVDLDLGTSKSYVIRDIKKERSPDGQAVITVRAEGYAFKYLDKIVPLVTDFAGVTATIFLDQILSGTGLTVGTNQIPTTEKRTVHIEYPNVIEALNVVTDNWDETAGGVKKRFFWRINENNTVDIFREDTFGSTIVPKVSPSKALISLQKEISSRRLVNRMFAGTVDGQTLAESQSTGYYDTIDGPDITAVASTDTINLDAYADTTNKVLKNSKVYVQVTCSVTWDGTASGADSVVFGVRGTLKTSGDVFRSEDIVTVTITGQASTTKTAQAYLLLDPYANTDIAKMVIKFDSFTGATAKTTAKKIFLAETWYWTGPNVEYADGANQGTYGVVEGLFTDPDLSVAAFNLISDIRRITGSRASPTYTNQAVNSDLTGTYGTDFTGGCEGWGTVGVISADNTFSENTTKDFILHGTKSQFINPKVGLTSGLTMKYGFPVRKRLTYFIYLNLYLVSGKNRIALDSAQFGGPGGDVDLLVNGAKWVTVTIENFVPSADGIYWLRILGDESGAGDCYLDAAMVTIQRSDGRPPFTRKSIADDLRTKALDAMGLNEAPAKTFALDLADLGELEPNVESARRFQPGDYIPIDDKILNVSATLRVQSKTTDLLHPEKTQISVELLPTRAGDVIFRALGRRDLALQRS